MNPHFFHVLSLPYPLSVMFWWLINNSFNKYWVSSLSLPFFFFGSLYWVFLIPWLLSVFYMALAIKIWTRWTWSLPWGLAKVQGMANLTLQSGIARMASAMCWRQTQSFDVFSWKWHCSQFTNPLMFFQGVGVPWAIKPQINVLFIFKNF